MNLNPTDDEPELDSELEDDEVELDDQCWDALAVDDDYEPLAEPGDFWTEQDAA